MEESELHQKSYNREPVLVGSYCEGPEQDPIVTSQDLEASQNGLLSYENPNYHLDPARLDDALNSNTDTAERLYEELCHELDAVCLAGGGGGGTGGGVVRGHRSIGMKGMEDGGAMGRRNYATLDIGSMGVDVTSGPVIGSSRRKQQAPKQKNIMMDEEEDIERGENMTANDDSDNNENNRGRESQCQHRKQLRMNCSQSIATYDSSSTTLSSSTTPTTCLPSAPPLDNNPMGCITLDNGNEGNCVEDTERRTMGRRVVDTYSQSGNMTPQLREDHQLRQHKNGVQVVRASSKQPDLIQHVVESHQKHQQKQIISPLKCNVRTEELMEVNSPEPTDSEIQVERRNQRTVDIVGLQSSAIPHIQGHLNNDLYAVPVKRQGETGCRGTKREDRSSSEEKEEVEEDEESEEDEEESEEEEHVGSSILRDSLPPGWERHEDGDGPYYWHIKSGTIQREPPTLPINGKNDHRRSLAKEAESALNNYQPPMFNTVTRSSTSSALEDLDSKKKEERKEEMAFKRRSYPARSEPEPVVSIGGSNSNNSITTRERPIRFAVRSLGWVEIAEEDLTPERSSKAVNKCIVDLSLGRNDLLDVVGRWGDGKDLFMDLDEGALKLIDPENLTVLNTQPIHTIRVWGVGRDNGRDFAYVARDRTTRKHMCHVFRCDIPARTIANTLRDICKKIMIERSLQQNLAKPIDIIGGGGGSRSGLATRPTNLPTEHRRFHHRNGQALVTQSFPTPMEEPKKVLRAQYLGQTQVGAATGMDVLNDAIDLMKETFSSPEQWRHVNVAVAPSMISILDPSDDNKLVAECRVRYLSFLGIGKNVKQCGFIMHTAQDLFIAHIFHCEPSSGALCKTVEAACKLRYQKCLDAHPQSGVGGWGSCHGNSTGGMSTSGNSGGNGQVTGGGGAGSKSLTATLKLLVGSLTGGRRGGVKGGNRGRSSSALGSVASNNNDS